jgi:hypothetical protein
LARAFVVEHDTAVRIADHHTLLQFGHQGSQAVALALQVSACFLDALRILAHGLFEQSCERIRRFSRGA